MPNRRFNQGEQLQSRGATTSGTVRLRLRLHLIRHAETEANSQRIVIGQSDSPLTTLGMAQATALGQSDFIKSTPFWRTYTSDLGRTVESLRLLQLPLDQEVLVEPRLRELAKGAREGLPKHTTYDEALRMRGGRNGNGDNEPPPLLESEQAALGRLHSWLEDVVLDAIHDFTAPGSDVCNVLAMSHSGCIRTLVGAIQDETPPVLIPNVSVTIIELLVESAAGNEDDGTCNFSAMWRDAKLAKRCWCPHLEELEGLSK